MQADRIKLIEESFFSQFGCAPELIVRAPGRVNLIGEHTDYNQGFVFPVAIDREMLVAASTNLSDKVLAYSLDYKELDSFDIKDIKTSQKHTWSNYLRAVVSVMCANKMPITGFNVVLSGNVPQGAGLSSSAAYEVAIATVCDQFFKLSLSGKDVALLSQRAENEFIGVQCGIMDQFISALGAEDSALLIDCKSLDYRVVPLRLSENGYSIVITNSGVRRGLVDSQYNARRNECNEGVIKLRELLNRPLESLRDVELADLAKHEHSLSETVRRRCRHVVSENHRVLDSVAALEAGDLKTLGRLMNESHTSLQEDYEVSCPQIDTLVELSQNYPGVLGARITGGGFGGCTVAIVANDTLEGFKSEILPEYESRTGHTPEMYVCTATAGASAVLAVNKN